MAPNSNRPDDSTLIQGISQEALEIEAVTGGRIKAADHEKMLIAGAKAWADVPDAAKWVRELRDGT